MVTLHEIEELELQLLCNSEGRLLGKQDNLYSFLISLIPFRTSIVYSIRGPKELNPGVSGFKLEVAQSDPESIAFINQALVTFVVQIGCT